MRNSFDILTPTELELMLRRIPIGGAQAGEIGAADVGPSLPFRIHVDARPLAALAQSACVGHRLYEFMTIRRQGDVLRYLWIYLTDVPDDVLKSIRSSVKFQRRFSREDISTLTELPFVEFDRCFWRQESDWLDDDMSDVHHCWIGHRHSGHWERMSSVLLDAVRAIQSSLRQSAKGLTQHEISLIDRGAHRRDCWAHRELVGRPFEPPRAETSLPPALLDMIAELVRQPDVNSVSCSIKDYALWRVLALEQLQRSKARGVAPQDALFLAGPDGGIPNVVPKDWGTDIHIPWEGACAGDLFEVPDWFTFHFDEAAAKGTVRGGIGLRECKYVLSRTPLGTFENDVSTVCNGWTIYKPR